MTEQTECRWSWCNPESLRGAYWYSHDPRTTERPMAHGMCRLIGGDNFDEGWWAFHSEAETEPLPPKRKVTQTLWMVPIPWTLGDTGTFTQRWLSTDDTIPPGAIETVQKREVEL